jgi:tetratricopeptide (TPR) repeat protein
LHIDIAILQASLFTALMTCLCICSAGLSPAAAFDELAHLNPSLQQGLHPAVPESRRTFSRVKELRDPRRFIAESILGGRPADPKLTNQERRVRAELEAAPYSLALLENVAGILERNGGMTQAVELYSRMLELPIHPDKRAEVEQNIAVLESRFRAAESYAAGARRLGDERMALGDNEGAIAWFTRAVELDPELYHAYFSRGLALMRSGAVREAARDLEQAAILCPTFRGAYLKLGLAQETLGRKDKAFESFRLAAENDPKDPEALANFAYRLEARGDHDTAAELYEAALRRKPAGELGRFIRERLSSLSGKRNGEKAGARRKSPRSS